jgi:hypothetical protein
MEGHHYFQAAGFNLKQVELFHSSPNCPAADLFNNSYSMIGVDNLVAYVEITVAQHVGTPKSGRKRRNNTSLLYPRLAPGCNLGMS